MGDWDVVDEFPAGGFSGIDSQPAAPQASLGDWDVVDEQPANGYDPLPAAQPTQQKEFSFFDDALLAGKAIGSGLYSAAADVFPKTVAEVYRGGDMPLHPTDWAGQTVAENTADLKSRELPPEEANREVFGLIKAKDIQSGLSNLGYSAGSMAAGMGAGALAGSVVPGPGTAAGAIAGAVGAGAAGFATGYRSAGDQFVEDIRQRVLAADPNLTEEKWGEIKQAISGDKQLYSLWEAGPEAVGEALTMGLIKTPAGKIIKEIPFIKNNVARFVAGAAAKAAIDVPVELAGETATQMGQTAISAPYTGEKAQNFSEALADVGPQTVVMTLATLGLGGLAERYTPSNINAREATQAIYDLVGDNQHKLLNDTELSTAEQAAEYLLKQHPSTEARDSLRLIQSEREARAAQAQQASPYAAEDTRTPRAQAEAQVLQQQAQVGLGPFDAREPDPFIGQELPQAQQPAPAWTPPGESMDWMEEPLPGSSPIAQHVAQGGGVDLLSGKPVGYGLSALTESERTAQDAAFPDTPPPVAPIQQPVGISEPALSVSPQAPQELPTATFAPVAAPVVVQPRNVDIRPGQPALDRGEVSYQRPATGGDSPIFYSQMQRVLEKPGMLPKIATANSMLGVIKKHIGKFKGVELEESGLTDWLSSLGPKMVTRQDVLDEVAGRQIKLGEVTHADFPGELGPRITREEAEDAITNRRGVVAVDPDTGSRYAVDSLYRLIHGQPKEWPLHIAPEKLPSPKFAQYQVPGGENYKETLVTLPKENKIIPGSENVWNAFSQARYFAPYSTLTPELQASVRRETLGSTVDRGGEYRSSHWDEPNVLAHLRTNERTDTDGKKTLFVEEIQSDWHQEGKKKGYTQTIPTGEVVRVESPTRPGQMNWRIEWSDGTFSGGYGSEEAAQRALHERALKKASGVPDAPFKNTSSWSLLAMKRAIRQAVEGGMDRVAWTPGEVQAERYDLAKQVDSVEYKRERDGSYRITANKNGKQVIGKGAIPESDLPGVVGKELAQKIVDSPEPSGEFSGLDLRVGGEGMKGFYDQILPKEVAKYIKQFGGKVGETTISADDKALFEVLRDSVEENLGGEEYDRAQESLSRMEAEINKDGIDKSIEMEEKYGDPEMAGIFKATLENIRDNLADYDIPGQKVWSFDITPEMKKAAMEGQPLYKKGDSEEAPAGVDAALAKDIAAKLGVNTESMVIGPKLGIAPRELLAQMEMDKAMNTGGAYYRGKSYIFTDNHEDLDYTGRAILHEAFHEGVVKSVERMAKKLGLEPARNRVRAALQTIYSTNAREVQRNSVNRKYGHDFSRVSDRLQATEEWLAMNAETVKPKLMDRYISAIRAFIRAVGRKLGIKGLDLNWSEAETRNFIRDALEAQRSRIEVGDSGPLYQNAWHGSSLKFDKFDSGKVNTGTGEQGYGHGLYFTSMKKIAEWYRKNLLDQKKEADRAAVVDGKKVPLGTAKSRIFGEANTDYQALVEAMYYANKDTIHGMYDGKGIIQSLVSKLKKLEGSADGSEKSKNAISRARVKAGMAQWEAFKKFSADVSGGMDISDFVGKTRDMAQEGVVRNYAGTKADKAKLINLLGKLSGSEVHMDSGAANETGQLYRVEIPDNANLMVLEEQFPNQPASVQKALIRSGVSATSDLRNGWQIYEALVKDLGTPAKASEFLASNGIPGHRYLSEELDSEESGNYNYVIYRDSDVDIKKTYYQRGSGSAVETAGASPNEVEEARRLWAEMGTDSPYFARWFGDSKVVDGDGKPLVVYHGTGKSGFSVFMRGQGGYMYFTPDPEYANRYAGKDGGVYHGFLSMKNPIDLTYFGDADVGGVWLKDYLQEQLGLDMSGIDFNPGTRPLYNQIKHPEFKWRLQDLGFDGIKQIEDGAVAYLAFEPEQFKSATGNRGTFDAGNPDIRYSLPKTKEEQLAQARERLAKAMKGTIIRPEDGIAADPAKIPMSKDGAVAWLRKQYQDYVDQYAPVLREAGKLSPEAKAELQNRISFLRGGGGAVDVILTGKGGVFNYANADPSKTVPGSKSLAAVLEPIKGDPQMIEAFDLLLKGERQIALAKYRPEIARKDYLADRKYWLDALKDAPNPADRKLIREHLKALKTAFVRQVKGVDAAYWSKRIPEVETTLGPEKTAEVRQAMKDYRAFLGHAVLDRLAEAGVLSQEAYKAIKNAPEHEWYAPMQRQMDQIEQSQAQFVGHRDVIKRLKGSLRNTLPAVESAIAYVDRSVRLVAQNNVAKAFLTVRDANPDLAQAIREVRVDPARVSGDRYIRVIEDGKKRFFEAPKEFVQALNGITPQEANLFKQIMAIPAKALRFGATMSLEFPVRNLMRDQWSAMINSNYGYIPFVGAINGMMKIAAKDSVVAEWKAAGGDQAYFTSLDRAVKHVQAKELLGMQEKGLVRYFKNPGELAGAIAEGLRSVSDFAEKGTRVGLYVNARKRGATPGEAATEARMSTLDFGRMGLSGRGINSIIAFWNANVQDVDILARNLRDKPGRTLAKIALGVTLPSVLLWAAQHDDDRYKSTPQWLKDTFWVIYPWWDKEAKVPMILPKPFLMGALFGSSVEHMLDYAVDKKRDGLKDAVRGVITVGVPGFMPTIFGPILEWWTNYSFFRGRSLESQSDQKLPPSMRANTQTQEVFRKLGNMLDVSPIKLENTMRGYTGNLGLSATAAVSAGLEAVDGKDRPTPVAKRLTEQPGIKAVFGREPIGSNSQQVTDFYDNLERASQAEAGLKVLAESGDKAALAKFRQENLPDISMAKVLKETSQDLGDIRKSIAAIQKHPTMASEAKRQRIDQLNRRMTKIAEQANAVYEKRKAK